MVISSVSVDTGRTDFTFVVIDCFNSEDTSSDGSQKVDLREFVFPLASSNALAFYAADYYGFLYDRRRLTKSFYELYVFYGYQSLKTSSFSTSFLSCS